jgi:hypothetical protein
MLPSVSIRIQNVIKSLECTILPSIDPDSALALEQATLAIAQLKVIDEQWDRAKLFEAGSLQSLSELASHFVAIKCDDKPLQTLQKAMTTALENARGNFDTVAQIEQQVMAIGSLVDECIAASYQQEDAAVKQTVSDLVLNYSQYQADRERVWFKSTLLDPDVKDLESIDMMLGRQLTL